MDDRNKQSFSYKIISVKSQFPGQQQQNSNAAATQFIEEIPLHKIHPSLTVSFNYQLHNLPKSRKTIKKGHQTASKCTEMFPRL